MTAPLVQLGRYELLHPIASGGMATVYEGKLVGPAGFSRHVAIKRMHPHFAADPEFVAMFLDEARLAARIRHPNVVATLDVVTREGELLIVMEYVHGETLATLVRRAADHDERVPAPVALAVLRGALAGLHAAHEATSDDGVPLGIVHRDVSPQNLLVGADGVTRILDFGIAKASGRAAATREGELKGKLRYMSPEQVSRKKVDRRSDVYAAACVLWEALTGQRLVEADDAGGTVMAIVQGEFSAPSTVVDGLPEGLDAVVMRGLARDVEARFATALDMARALEPFGPAPLEDVGAWVQRFAGDKDREPRAAGAGPAVGRASLPTATLPVGEAAPLVELVEVGRPVVETRSFEAQPVEALVDGAQSSEGGEAVLAMPSPRGRGRGVIVAVVLGLVATIGLWAMVAPSQREGAAGAGDDAVAAGTAPEVRAPEVRAPQAREPEVREPEEQRPEGTASARVPLAAPKASTATMPTTRTTPTSGGAAGGVGKTKAGAQPKGASCDPPYAYDAEGNRVYKKGCL